MDRRIQRFTLGQPWEHSHGYSQAFRVGSLVHIAGQIPHDENGDLVAEHDPRGQAEAAFANLNRVLAGIGASKRQVVDDTIYVVGLSKNFNAISDVHNHYFDGHNPTSTVVGVVELVFPGQLLEVSARVDLTLRK